MAVIKFFVYWKVDFQNFLCPRVGKFEENHPYAEFRPYYFAFSAILHNLFFKNRIKYLQFWPNYYAF